MDSPFLLTKFFIPNPHKNSIPRQDLIRRLEDGRASGVRLFYLSAPAGSGKTSLISDWVDGIRHKATDVRVGWLSLDPADDDYIRFFSYLTAAIQTIDPNLTKNAETIIQNPINLYQEETFLASLINDVACYAHELIIVLDDYQNIIETKIQHSMGFIIDHLPINVKFVILTRADPPLAFARWQASGYLLSIRGDDLRFSIGETEQYFNDLLGLDITAEEIGKLNNKTDGWPAGLNLLALSFEEAQDIHTQIANVSENNRYILDYLVEEVLSRQPQDVQEFLFYTSCLERLNAGLCDAVTGNQNGQAMLTYIENQNLFLQPLDTERCWYRYYHIFAGIIQIRMRSRAGYEKSRRMIFQKASAWCEREGILHEAIVYALQAYDTDRAASLIEQFSYSHFLPGGVSATMAQIRCLPEDVVLARPRLSLVKAWGLFTTGHLEQSETYLMCAEAVCGKSDPATLAEIHALRAMIFIMKNDPAASILEAQNALTLISKHAAPLRAFTLFTLGMGCELAGQIDEAEAAYQESYRLSLDENDLFISIISGCQLGDISFIRGKLDKAERIYHDILSRLDMPARNSPILGMLYASLAKLYYERNDLEISCGYYQKCIDLGTSWETQDILLTGYLGVAQISLARGDSAETERYLIRSSLIQDRLFLSPPMAVIFRGVVVKLRTQMGQGEALEDLVRINDELSNLAGPWQEVVRSTKARVRLVQQRYTDALAEADAGIQSSKAEGRISNYIEFLMLKAQALQQLHQKIEAADCLNQALRTASQSRYQRTFLDEGEPLCLLMESLSETDVPYEYLHLLLDQFHQALGYGKKKMDISRMIGPGITLSNREMEVLRLIADGYSNREIADRLVLALSTVKSHINNIFMKMDVENRTSALAKAREIGLFSDLSTP